mgnify:CR=1 FL=1
MTPEELYLEAYQELVIAMQAAAKALAKRDTAKAKADAAWEFRVSERAKAVWATPMTWNPIRDALEKPPKWPKEKPE